MKFFAIFTLFGMIIAALAAPQPQGVGSAIAGDAAGTVAGLGGSVIGKLYIFF